MTTTTYAVLDIRGERTTGPAPHYGTVRAIASTEDAAWQALDSEVDRQIGRRQQATAVVHLMWTVGIVATETTVGQRVSYTAVAS